MVSRVEEKLLCSYPNCVLYKDTEFSVCVLNAADQKVSTGIVARRDEGIAQSTAPLSHHDTPHKRINRLYCNG